MTIRPATAADIPRIVEIGRQFCEEARWGDLLEIDPDSLAASLAGLIEGGVVLVAEPAGAVVGAACAVLFPLYLNHAHLAAAEMFWWVDPEHRGGVGGDLLDALERAVEERGAATFSMLTVAGLRDQALGRLYRRRGYRPAETTYTKRF